MYLHLQTRHAISRRCLLSIGLVLAFAMALLAANPAIAVDLENLPAVGGPLAGALTQLGGMTAGAKALVGFLAFVFAFVALSAMRNFGPVFFFIGVVIFGAVGLAVGSSILGATI